MDLATSEGLAELRERWVVAVTLRDHTYESKFAGAATIVVPQPCWFAENLDVDECEGRHEGAHFLKRQTVERVMARNLELPEVVTTKKFRANPGRWIKRLDLPLRRVEALFLAAWDPRNGVCACSKHHARFDSNRVALPSQQIVVWRHQVPAHVEAFARDWGLEPQLADRCPAVGAGL